MSLSISSKAVDVLLYLIERKGEIVLKQEFLDNVWTDRFVEEANLHVHISALRRVLGEEKGEHKFIKTIPGRGYSFIAPVRAFDSREEYARQNNPSKSVSNNTARVDSIAILPFTFNGRNEEKEYLTTGITQSLINDLSQIANLRVLSFSAVKKYKNSEADLQEIGFLLDANKILTGQISELKGKLEIVVELVNVENKSIIWGTEQIFESDDLFRVKKEISVALFEKLKLKLGEGFSSPKEIKAEAQKLYYRGKTILESRTGKGNIEETLHQAIRFFEEAIKIEPQYALAYVGIGSAYASLHNHNLFDRGEAYQKAVESLETALGIDNRLSEAYVLKGSIEVMFEGDLTLAEKSLNTAIELNHNNPDAYHWKGLVCLCQRKYREALEFENKATRLDPTSTRFNEQLTRIFFYSGDFEKAITQAEEMLEFNANSLSSYFLLALSYAQMGSFDIALENIEKAIQIRNVPDIILNKAYICGLAGDRVTAENIINQVLNTFPPSQIDYRDVALVYVALDDADKAFDYLNKAMAKQTAWVSFLKADFRFDTLRSDKRFEDL